MAQDILKRLKANRVKVGIGEPHVNEGANGDFSLRRTTSGIVLYIKHEITFLITKITIYYPDYLSFPK